MRNIYIEVSLFSNGIIRIIVLLLLRIKIRSEFLLTEVLTGKKATVSLAFCK